MEHEQSRELVNKAFKVAMEKQQSVIQDESQKLTDEAMSKLNNNSSTADIIRASVESAIAVGFTINKNLLIQTLTEVLDRLDFDSEKH